MSMHMILTAFDKIIIVAVQISIITALVVLSSMQAALVEVNILGIVMCSLARRVIVLNNSRFYGNLK